VSRTPGPEEARQAAIKAGSDPLAGVQALNLTEGFIKPYLALPSEHCIVVLVLWAAHTHAAHRFYVTPRLILDSPEPSSGKTRVLELLALVSYSPKLTINTTVAALYRRLDKAGERPLTVLFDETDAVFNPRTADKYEDLRALLNAGYKRGATVDRCVGEGSRQDVKEFPVFAPVALAGLAGHMPATITTRAAAEIHMRKRAPSETVKEYDEEDALIEAKPVRAALAAWVESVTETLGAERPEMPAGVEDRPKENWRALLAIADAAGGDWPERARAACRYFVLGITHKETFGVRLLRDIRTVFTVFEEHLGDDGEPVRIPVAFADRMKTADILERLTGMEEAPWADLKGKPLDATRLADELGRYGVHSKQMKFPEPGDPGKTKGAKGYHVPDEEGLADAWTRHLPDHATYLQESRNPRNDGNRAGQPVSPGEPVSGTPETIPHPETMLTSEVTPVSEVSALEAVAE
jgi:Protein of unknown function (DUF3631)